MNCIIHIDGGARGNPGPAAVGVVIQDAQTRQPLHEGGYFLGIATNNVAEYNGLVRGLEVAIQLGAASVYVHSDSELLVKQIKGEYRVKSPDLKPLYQRARDLFGKIGQWKITHVRRELNKRADELANMAMDRRRDFVVPLGRPSPAAEPPSSSPASAAPATGSASPEAPPEAPLPCWTAELSGRAGRCLAGQSTGNPYTFGPTTPEGFCVHAAAAVLSDGPLQWSPRSSHGQTRCQRCALTIKMTRLA